MIFFKNALKWALYYKRNGITPKSCYFIGTEKCRKSNCHLCENQRWLAIKSFKDIARVEYTFTPVDQLDRKAMADYLSGHCRYYVNKERRLTSYAQDIQDIPHNVKNRLLPFMETEKEQVLSIIDKWESQYDFHYQVRFDDHYMILFRGEKVNGEKVIFPYSYLDMEEDFYNWTDSFLRERVRLVESFDQLYYKIINMGISHKTPIGGRVKTPLQ